MVELLRTVDDLHPSPAKHVGRPQKHRIADPLGDAQRLVAAARDAVGGLLEPELGHEGGKTLAVFRKVDAVGGSAEDRNASRLQLRRELQRSLPAKLNDDSEQFALLRLAPDDLEH